MKAVLATGGLVAAGALAQLGCQANAAASKPSPAAKRDVRNSLRLMPLAFEANHGQTAGQVRFLARASDYMTFITPSESVINLTPHGKKGYGRSAAVKMRLQGARKDAKVVGLDKLPGKVNYFIGGKASDWHTDIPTYARVKCEQPVPGVDLFYYGNSQQLEYDMVVAPGVDPEKLTMCYDGVQGLSVAKDGKLLLETSVGTVYQPKPIAYQVDGSGRKVSVDASFQVASANAGSGKVRFELGAYDASRPVVIDPPVQVYLTYLGGSQTDTATDIVTDNAGNAYVTGYTASANFPSVPSGLTRQEIWTAKFTATGTLAYTAFMGGSLTEYGGGIAVNTSGQAIVCGTTQSFGRYSPADNVGAFPTTAGAYQRELGGSWDAVVFKLSATGNSLLYSSYVGGGNDDRGFAIATDSTGSVAYLTGRTNSNGFFPFIAATKNGFDTTCVGYDSYLIKLSLNASQGSSTATSYGGIFHDKTDLLYNSYVGGSADEGTAALDVLADMDTGVACDNSGYAYLVGDTKSSDFPTSAGTFQPTKPGAANTLEGYVVKVNTNTTNGASKVWATYLGGGGGDYCLGVAVDSSGNVYTTGVTSSSGSVAPAFPTANAVWSTYRGGLSDAFVTKLNSTGTALVFSTFLGGADADQGSTIRTDAIGNTYVVGRTPSSNFQIMPSGTIQPVYNGNTDLFITKFRPDGSGPIFSTYLGGTSFDYATGLAIDINGQAYVCGYTTSGGLTTLNAHQSTYGGGSYDAIVGSFVLNDAPTFTSTAPSSSSLPCTSGGQAFGYTVSVQDVNSDNLKVEWCVQDPGEVGFTLEETDTINGPAVVLSPPTLTPTTGSASFNRTVSAIGVTNFQVKVTDGLASVTQSWSVTITDTDAPVFTGAVGGDLGTSYLNPTNDPLCDAYEGTIAVPAVTDCQSYTVTGSVADPDAGGATNNGDPGMADATEYGRTITSGSPNWHLKVGETYVITWTAVDGSGNTSYATQTIMVADVVAPVLVIPNDVTVPQDPGQPGADLTPQELGILDGSSNPLYSATDNCGTSFIIAFRDRSWPNDPGELGYDATDPTHDDGVPEHNEGYYPLGRSVITWIAFDEALNFTELYQTITVTGTNSVTSEFSSDDESWTTYGTDVTAVSYNAAGGNPGGNISASQPNATSSTWFFEAPSKFLADTVDFNPQRSGAYGQTLTFDLKISGTANVSSDEGVILAGNGITIYAPLSATPTGSWTAQSLTLSTATAWKVDDGDGNLGNDVLANATQIQDVISSLASLKIRGKFDTTAGAATYLDNVVLNQSYAAP